MSAWCRGKTGRPADRERQSAIARKFHCDDPEPVRSFPTSWSDELMPPEMIAKIKIRENASIHYFG
jgi:hypothetical protein